MSHRPLHTFRSSAWLAASLAFVTPRAAHADRSIFASPWSEESRARVGSSLESPELRTLRLAELELFGPGHYEPVPSDFDPDDVYKSSAAISSDVGAREPERAIGKAQDLSFLKDLKLPKLPVRWDARVVDYLLFFKNERRGRDLAAAWLKRTERYGPMIRRVLKAHGLPEDLQYVAMIESGYDPTAHSHAQARGMWQFVKQPAEFYGLRVDRWVDERLDPERATEAGAMYLRDLYERFGAWDLAFAAYNMGYPGLLRAMRKYNTNDYWLLSHTEAGLPFETSMYVAKITAMAIVAENPERFGFHGLDKEKPVRVTQVEIPAGTSIKQLASYAGVTLDLLKARNPHLLKGRIPPGEQPVRVYIPEENAATFAKHWAKKDVAAFATSDVVRFGESIEDVARRHGVTPSELRSLNELGRDVQVRTGFPLLIPGGAKASRTESEPQIASVPAKEFRYEGRRRVFYRVATGDTLQSVARFFDLSVDELIAWNNLNENASLQRDMLLQLFVSPSLDLHRTLVLTPDQVNVVTMGSDEFHDLHQAERARARVLYRVQPDDTLAKIGEKFELSAGSLGRINQVPSNKELTVDDWIIVYAPEDKVSEFEKKGLVKPVLSPRSKALMGTAHQSDDDADDEGEARDTSGAEPPETEKTE